MLPIRSRSLAPALRTLAAISVACLTILTSVGCSFAKGPGIDEMAGEINRTLGDEQFVITPGDMLEVSFRIEDAYNQEVPVLPDGMAVFRTVGAMRVAGFTPEYLRGLLVQEYRAKANINDEISLSISEYAPRTVTILGEVEEPGEIPLGPDQNLTLIQALGQAGSFTKASAWLSNTLIIRWDAERQKQITWIVDARPKNWRGEQPIFLQHFDVIFVPNTHIDNIGVILDNFVRRMLPLPYVPI